MPKTNVSCPNCHQSIVADIDRLFDLGTDPTAKQRLLTGAFNVVLCSYCGYQGQIATPIVYHDPEIELLLTFVPPEVGLPHDEQERVIGSMINQVTNDLPQDKRKGYLLRPQATLTMQGLVERVLEADGITKEMIQAQQEKIQLIQRLLETTDEKEIGEIAQNEDTKIDAEFFVLLQRLTGASIQSGDQETARKLEQLQRSSAPFSNPLYRNNFDEHSYEPAYYRLNERVRQMPQYNESSRNHLSELFNNDYMSNQPNDLPRPNSKKMNKTRRKKMFELEKEKYSLEETLKKLESKFESGNISEIDFFKNFKNLQKDFYTIDKNIETIDEEMQEEDFLRRNAKKFDRKRYFT